MANKLHTYLITTSTDDKWQVIGGNYIIVAASPTKARKLLEDSIELDVEDIENIKRIDIKKENVVNINRAIIR